MNHSNLYFDALDGKTYLFWAIGAAAAFSMTLRRIQASRAIGQPYAQGQQPGYGQEYPPR